MSPPAKVEVAVVEVAVKYGAIEAPYEVMFDTIALVALRFVAKELVEVAFVVVEFVAIIFAKMRFDAVRLVTKRLVEVALVPVAFKNVTSCSDALPVAVRSPPIYVLPATESFAKGDVVPIPTLPELATSKNELPVEEDTERTEEA